MPDDREERRQKDLRDLEFYRQRVRPSATDLWRTLDRRGLAGGRFVSDRGWRGREADQLNLRTPTSLADVLAEDRPGEREPQSAETADPDVVSGDRDAIWPLIVALFVLSALAWTGKLDRVASAVLF